MKNKYHSFELKIEEAEGNPIYKLYGYKKLSLQETANLFANQKRGEQSPLLELVKEFSSFEEAENFMKNMPE